MADKLTIKGYPKTLVVDGPTIKIMIAGGLFSAPREKAILIRNISAVEVKEPGFLRGYIRFILPGTAQWAEARAATDENTVVFSAGWFFCNYKTALKIKEYVEAHRDNQNQNIVVNVTPTGAPAAHSVADEISKLKGLMDQGIISAKDFEKKKRELLG